MKPYFCQSPHNPPNSYGDCLQACVASLLEMHPSEVPHFMIDGNASLGWKRFDEFLMMHRLGHVFFPIEADTFRHAMQIFSALNPNVYYLVGGETSGGAAHVVIALNDRVMHNPSLMDLQITKPIQDSDTGLMYWPVYLILDGHMVPSA